MNIKKLITTLAVVALAVSANAVTLTNARLLGTIEPGTPANPDNEAIMVNFLVAAYNTSPTARTLGDNPLDPQTEVYKLKPGSSIPAGPLTGATGVGAINLATSNGNINLGTGGWLWITAKYGSDSEVLYLGGLTGSITLANFIGNGNGLSGYTLFKGGTSRVPDGGATVAVLGLSLLGLGAARRKLS